MADDNNGYGVIVVGEGNDNQVTDTSSLFSNNYKILGAKYRSNSEINKNNKETESADSNSSDNAGEVGLFVTNESGGKPDQYAKYFFNLLKALTGNIFNCNLETGKITLQDGKTSDSVISTSKTSKTLAKIIDDNCGENATQKIMLRVGNQIRNILVDDYFSGKVDISDLNNILNECVQGAFIYHFIHERVNTLNYEVSKLKTLKSDFEASYHKPALKAEVAVLKEMGENPTFPERFEFPVKEFKQYYFYEFSWGKVEVEFNHFKKNSKIKEYKFSRQ